MKQIQESHFHCHALKFMVHMKLQRVLGSGEQLPDGKAAQQSAGPALETQCCSPTAQYGSSSHVADKKHGQLQVVDDLQSRSARNKGRHRRLLGMCGHLYERAWEKQRQWWRRRRRPTMVTSTHRQPSLNFSLDSVYSTPKVASCAQA